MINEQKRTRRIEEAHLFRDGIYQWLSKNPVASIDLTISMIINDKDLLKALREGEKTFLIYEESRKNSGGRCEDRHFSYDRIILNGEGLIINHELAGEVMQDPNEAIGSWEVYAEAPIFLKKEKALVDFNKSKLMYVEHGDDWIGPGKDRYKQKYEPEIPKGFVLLGYILTVKKGIKILKNLESLIRGTLCF